MTDEIIGNPEEVQATPTRGPGRPRREAAPVGVASELTEAKPGAKRRKRVGENDRQILPDTSRLDQSYTYRLVTDIHNNVNSLLDRGYEIVNSDRDLADKEAGKASSLSSQVSIIANPSYGDKGVLMRIPKDLYAEDQADKQRIVDKTEERIYKDLSNQKGLYNPADKNGPVGPSIQR